MTEKTLPKSARKFIRLEKARIRRQFLDIKKQEELIAELYNKTFNKLMAVEAKEPEKAKEPKTKAPKAKSKSKAKVSKLKNKAKK